ncbi:MAG TPA: M20 family metallopeptidase [Anaerolineales bacterium]|nr:M20 family metallopeptidase [Anaerolineales bacterium]
MLENLTPHLKAQEDPLKKALIELVRIPSVCDEGGNGYPFGEAIDQALRKALQIANDLGFKTQYGDGGYYGFAEVGEGKEMLGILGHMDVVPPGKLEDWKYGPFDPVESDGMLYGRGTQDDKGPMLASLYAVKALTDAGVTFNKRIRFIIGTDEETLWRCINRYNENEEMPGFGFSPDARFPVTYAEKGLLQLQLEGSNESGIRLSGGSAFNAVPDSILYEGERQDDLAKKLDQLGFEYERGRDGIEVKGKAAHAMIPEEGINAIARLCMALKEIGVESKAINFVAQEIGQDPYAARVFGECADEPSGKLKFNIGKIELNQTEQLSIDSRLPVTASKQEIVAKLSAAAAKYGLEYKQFDWLAPIYLPLDNFIVTTLMDVYQRLSGDQVTEPMSSGGATYARAIQNCVAFGALTVDEPLTEHQPNERVVLENLYKAMEIYAHAVYELTR